MVPAVLPVKQALAPFAWQKEMQQTVAVAALDKQDFWRPDNDNQKPLSEDFYTLSRMATQVCKVFWSLH